MVYLKPILWYRRAKSELMARTAEQIGSAGLNQAPSANVTGANNRIGVGIIGMSTTYLETLVTPIEPPREKISARSDMEADINPAKHEGAASAGQSDIDSPAEPGSAVALSHASYRPAWIVLAAALATVLVASFLVLVSRQRPDPRNNPERLLAAFSKSADTSFELPELHTNLTSADLTFGEQQVSSMVHDRPELARYVSKDSALWQFCVRAFAGEVIGERILWDNNLPAGKEYRSDHMAPYAGQSGRIRIRKNYATGPERGQALSCEELWSCAVFEIENIRNFKAFLALYYKALQGGLSREEWIRANSKLEYGALRRTAEDYRRLWQPLALARQQLSSVLGSWSSREL